ncbi:PaaI family thioesterase (plasmid) [Streptomyces sp. BI20]|uniref:PaaI family thioesterase n=1 Tax=Streptomyces sp. BI20 TaxID=3403460 RepID=UPI003C736C2A
MTTHPGAVASPGERLAALFGGTPDIPIPGLVRRLGIEVTEARAERVTGLAPASASVLVLAETLGSVAAMLYAHPAMLPLGGTLHASHLGEGTEPPEDGRWIGVATPLHLGERTTVHRIEITSGDGTPRCEARLTCFLIPPKDPPR